LNAFEEAKEDGIQIPAGNSINMSTLQQFLEG
jgi:hypothetical protein